MNFFRKKIKKFTLVLGGGGARGLAHIGVLRSLEKYNYIPSLIVGTSMGAVIGAMYAQLRNATKVEQKVRDFIESDFFKQIGLEQFSDISDDNHLSVWERFAAHLRSRYLLSKTMLGTGAFAQTTLEKSIRYLLDEMPIENLPIQFAAITCDLKTGKEIVLTKGSLITAVTASSAVPGIVAPLEVQDQLLIDGTVTSTIPVMAALSLSDNPVVAVDVRMNLPNNVNPQRGYEVILRSQQITAYLLNDLYLQKASLVLRPEVGDIQWNEFQKIDRCISAGEESVQKIINKLSDTLKRPFISLFVKRNKL